MSTATPAYSSPGTAWLDAASERFAADMPAHFERMHWSPGQLRAHQTERLRALLATAISKSRYHHERLRGIDPSRFELEDLPTLPVMTKPEMMERFDDVVTDDRITTAAVEANLAAQGREPTLLFGEYVTLASGGSSGIRGAFVYHRDDAVTFIASILRSGMARLAATAGWPPPGRVPVALVAAPSAVHATGSVAHIARSVAAFTFAPATLPFDELCRRVREAQPMLLVGYTSMIARLADEQAAGRLGIEPAMVIVSGEQLTTGLSERIAAGFGVPPANSFGSSEGLNGSAPPGSDVFSVASDVALVELVDADDHPVRPGDVADHVLVTNLINPIQPLIRYRLDDRMIATPEGGDSGHMRVTVEGRSNETIRIGDAIVHPIAIRSVILQHPSIVEHQVLIDNARVTVCVVQSTPENSNCLSEQLAAALRAAGVINPTVEIRPVDRIARDPRTGKAKPLISLRDSVEYSQVDS